MVDIDSPGPARTGNDQPLASQQPPPTASAPASTPAAANASATAILGAAPTPASVLPASRRAPGRWTTLLIRAVCFAVMLFGALAIAGGTWDGAIFMGIGFVGLNAFEFRLRRRARRRT
jgi:hypothetical protein